MITCDHCFQAKRGILTALFFYKLLKSLIHKKFSIFHNLKRDGERNQETETVLLARSAAMASNSR